MPPNVTIAIPTIRRPEDTRRAIASVVNQDYAGVIECCVYVDGRDDDTRGMLKLLTAAHALRTDINARRILKWEACDENRGIAAAKNAALRMGTGELRGVLDSDDFYDPAFVSACVEALAANPDVVCVYTDNWHQTVHRKTLAEAGDWSIETLLTCRMRGDTYLARTAALRQTTLHDERMLMEADYDLFYQLANLGPLLRIPRPLVTCTEHPGRTTQADMNVVAYWHAAGLAKYGHGIEWAKRRAERHPEWLPAIADGYAHGVTLRTDAPPR